MVCEYFVSGNGKVFCRAYGGLENTSKERILDCESNFTECYERAHEFLKRKKSEEEGIGRHFNLASLE